MREIAFCRRLENGNQVSNYIRLCLHNVLVASHLRSFVYG